MSLSQFISIGYALVVIVGLTLEQFHFIPAGLTNSVLIALGSLHIGVVLPTPSTAGPAAKDAAPTDSASPPAAPAAGVHSPEVVQ